MYARCDGKHEADGVFSQVLNTREALQPCVRPSALMEYGTVWESVSLHVFYLQVEVFHRMMALTSLKKLDMHWKNKNGRHKVPLRIDAGVAGAACAASLRELHLSQVSVATWLWLVTNLTALVECRVNLTKLKECVGAEGCIGNVTLFDWQ